MGLDRWLEIELSGKCNLRCVMCPQMVGYEGKFITIDEVKQILPLTKDVNRVTLHGAGEVLLSPIFAETLDMIPDDKIVHFLSNGTMLKGDAVETILRNAHKMDYIMVSLDAITPATYKKIRGADYYKTVQNLLNFKKARDARGLAKPRILVDFCVMRENMEELPSFMMLANALDKECSFWPLLDDIKHSGDWVIRTRNWEFDYQHQLINDAESRDKLNKLLDAVDAINEVLGVKANRDSFHYMPEVPDDIRQCTLPQSVINFFSNGDVKHCCMQTRPLFNWREFEPAKYAEHPRHKKVIDLMGQGKVPLECGNSGCRYVLNRKSDEKSDGINVPIPYLELYKKNRENAHVPDAMPTQSVT